MSTYHFFYQEDTLSKQLEIKRLVRNKDYKPRDPKIIQAITLLNMLNMGITITPSDIPADIYDYMVMITKEQEREVERNGRIHG